MDKIKRQWSINDCYASTADEFYPQFQIVTIDERDFKLAADIPRLLRGEVLQYDDSGYVENIYGNKTVKEVVDILEQEYPVEPEEIERVIELKNSRIAQIQKRINSLVLENQKEISDVEKQIEELRKYIEKSKTS